jgi:hypothetical protein
MIRPDCGDDQLSDELYFSGMTSQLRLYSDRIHPIVGGCCGDGGMTSG